MQKKSEVWKIIFRTENLVSHRIIESMKEQKLSNSSSLHQIDWHDARFKFIHLSYRKTDKTQKIFFYVSYCRIITIKKRSQFFGASLNLSINPYQTLIQLRNFYLKIHFTKQQRDGKKSIEFVLTRIYMCVCLQRLLIEMKREYFFNWIVRRFVSMNHYSIYKQTNISISGLYCIRLLLLSKRIMAFHMCRVQYWS